jgi:ribosome biogenesis GTPase A
MAKDIQWFPGHMAKALREISERIKVVDIVIEICDARAPLSSINPELFNIIKNKPRIMILSKKDLADENITKSWLKYFEEKGYIALAMNLNKDNLDTIFNISKVCLKEKIEKDKRRGLKPQPIRALVVGIPNVGKSTFINKLSKRKATNVGNMPGVTKAQQWIKIKNDFELLDTPGVLWPKFENQEIGTKLALIGTIKQDILDKSNLAYSLLNYLFNEHPEFLTNRYGIELVDEFNDENEIVLLERIGRKRGLLKAKGEVEINRVEEIILKEFKEGLMGRYSLEKVDQNG